MDRRRAAALNGFSATRAVFVVDNLSRSDFDRYLRGFRTGAATASAFRTRIIRGFLLLGVMQCKF